VGFEKAELGVPSTHHILDGSIEAQSSFLLPSKLANRPVILKPELHLAGAVKYKFMKILLGRGSPQIF